MDDAGERMKERREAVKLRGVKSREEVSSDVVSIR
jgi:hypothetical protein